MRRVLKPSGTLAVWGYDLPQIPPQHAAANQLLKRLYADQLDPYWDAKRKLVDAQYGAWNLAATSFRWCAE
jgi:hypothetical protein